MLKKTLFAAALIWVCFSGSSFGQWEENSERIVFFDSAITVNEDGSMQVSENITVKCNAEIIKHGIFRDFPTRYKDKLKNNYTVDFEVTGVLKDNVPEEFFFKTLANGKRIYIGKKDVLLNPGTYTYTLTYNTNRQLGFFKDFDELYWNVTGNGWAFPIDKVKVTVKLPNNAGRAILAADGYTGPQGTVGKDFVSEVDAYGDVIFSSTRPLAPKEGLTIAVSWPKGFVKEPPLEAKIKYFLKDNRSVLAGLAGLLVIVMYYLVLWYLVGRDPAKGTIIPLYYPPENLSAAAIRYIMRMEYDNRIFACAVINMAVKGFLTIKGEYGVYTLIKTGKNREFLSEDENRIQGHLFSSGQKIVLRNIEHARISQAILSLKQALKKKFEKVYFFSNTWYFISGLLISLAMILLSVLSCDPERLPIALFMSVWLTIWSLGVVGLVMQVFSLWKMTLTDKAHRLGSAGQAVFLTLFSLPFIAGEIFGIGVLIYATSWAVLIVILAAVFINILFYHLLRAPTLMGRKIMDKIEGFKMYLNTAEKDELNLLNPPEKTPQLFEKYLPYALALGVEQKWAEKFTAILEKAAISSSGTYHPAWYSGIAWNSLGTSGFVSGLGNSFSSAVSSSSTPPGSSSGSGGGGSSGGGGGGGGGGGW